MQSNPNNTCQDETRSRCWKIRDQNTCENSASKHLSKEECCNTIGNGWGDDCDSCQNIPFTKIKCKTGYKYNPVKEICEDINECLILEPCKSGCENTEGSYYCTCEKGLTLDSDGVTCLDERLGECYSEFNGQQGAGKFEGLVAKDVCCCTVGKAWRFDNIIEACPNSESPEFNQLCPDRGGCYRPNPPLSTTEDCNECRHFPDLCGEHGTCINIDNCDGFRCECDPGFDINSKGLKCVDINECELSSSVCGRDANNTITGTCKNTLGGFECICKPGYELNKYGKCVDIDECKAFNVCRQGTCVNTLGSYTCACDGDTYRLSSDGTFCENINRCVLDPNLCANGYCVDTTDDYQCGCNAGYQQSTDKKSCININECSCKNVNFKHRCDPLATCNDLPGSYECLCPAGTRLAEDGYTCQDVDDCIEKPNICGIPLAGNCRNLAVEFINNGKDLSQGYECLCNAGFRLESGICVDINECLTDNVCGSHPNSPKDNLLPIGNCTNLMGSYTCDCHPGFCIDPELHQTNPNTPICIDEDECARGTHECHLNAECINLIGDYECRCKAGFKGDGYTCVDLNECETAEHNVCDKVNGVCHNRFGDYTCECAAGWHGNGINCTNIDECGLNDRLCHHGNVRVGECVDTEGSYQCNCNIGYLPTDDGKACIDQNECDPMLFPDVCANGICHNLHGSFSCQCMRGFELSKNFQNCVDVDECAAVNDGENRCRGGVCNNVLGGFECICKPHEEQRKLADGYFSCVDTRLGMCYMNLDIKNGQETCVDVIGSGDVKVTKAECCCSSLGSGWQPDSSNQDASCSMCPLYTENGLPNGNVTKEYIDLCNTDCPIGGCLEVDTLINKEDINECEVFGATACEGGMCINTAGSFDCKCPKGYQVQDSHGKLKKCVDINECESDDYVDLATGNKPCQPGGTCKNLDGGYRCECKKPEFIPHTWKGYHMCLSNKPGVCSNKILEANDVCVPGIKMSEQDLIISKRACCCIGNLGHTFECEVSFFEFWNEAHALTFS